MILKKILQHPSIGLVSGFGAILTLLLVVMLLSLNRLAMIQEHLEYIVKKQDAERNYVHTMYNTVRERSIVLHNIITVDDPFIRDDYILEFHFLAEQFLKAKNELTGETLSSEQRNILQRLQNDIETSVPILKTVLELAIENELKSAKDLLVYQAIPAQQQVLSTLQSFLDYEDMDSSRKLADANRAYEHARIFLISTVSLAIVIGILIAIATIKRAKQAELTIHKEKERAQTTLFSIGDAVITTDANGVIDMVNPAAEKILGQPQASLLTQHFSNICDRFDNQEAIDIPLMQAMEEDTIVFSSHVINMQRKDGAHFAIEFTASPIRDGMGHVIGGVLTMRDVTEMNHLAERLQFQASHDALTGLLNRREFEDRLEQAIVSARHEELSHILCYLDLDQFKVVNDTCGHSAGDELLKQLAPLLKPMIRGNDVLARLGGDEFGVLLEGCHPEKGYEIAERLKQTIKDYRFNWKNNVFEIGVSIGLVEINTNSGNMNEVMSAADSACYVAKDLGRNHIHVYRPDDAALVSRQGEMQWLQVINNAISKNRFTLFYQPIVPTMESDDRPKMYEFLIRLQGDDGNLVPPMAFIPAAERYNLASALDRWVVGNAIEFLSDNSMNSVLSNSLFTINLSAQSLSDQELLDYVLNCLERHDTLPSQICFEITETAAIANLSSAMEFISTLRDMGCRFALDDFGSGLSSYGYLKNLNVDFIKIDGNFIRNIEEDDLNQAFVTSISQIANIMGIQTIAEFVENEASAEFLKKTGITYLQGHWLGKPRPIEGLLYHTDTDPQRHLIHTI